MLEGNRSGMECKALVPFMFFAVTLVADHRVANAGEMHADLVLAAGQKINFQQTKLFGPLEHSVSRVGELAFARVLRRVDTVRLVLRQIRRDGLGLLLTAAVDDGEILLLVVLPLALQAKLRLFVLGENENSRSLAIEPVHDENPIPRFRDTLADVVGENEVRCARFFSICADG